LSIGDILLKILAILETRSLGKTGGIFGERSSIAPRSVSLGVRSRKLSNIGQSLDGLPKIYYLELFRASEGTLRYLFALGLRGGLWPFLLCVIHKEGLCLSSGDINRLMMMMMVGFALLSLYQISQSLVQ
jgi:hypothetical protein